MNEKYKNHNKDKVKSFYVVFFEDSSGFPDLTGYSLNLALAVSYAQQWFHLNPKIYMFRAKSVADVVNLNEYKSVSNHVYIGEDNMIISLDLMDRYTSYKYTDTKKYKREVMVTDRQLGDILDGGVDVIAEIIHYYTVSLTNLLKIAKYVRDPFFKKAISLIYARYLQIIVAFDGNDIDDLDPYVMNQLDSRIPANEPLSNLISISDYLCSYYLDYIVIKNNN